MGASTGQIVGLLLWQLIRPVLWVALIACPVAALVMSRWQQGFAYHVPLDPWLFAAATAVAILLALATVSTQSYLVARTRPVSVQRYERAF
jgi:putative ABC transport system permease protein